MAGHQSSLPRQKALAWRVREPSRALPQRPWINTPVLFFQHCHLIVAMKNHYSGHKHGLLPESLAYTEVSKSESFPLVTQLISAEPRICSLGGGRSILVFQVQNWVLYPYSADMKRAMSLRPDIRLASIFTCGPVLRTIMLEPIQTQISQTDSST
jgi:hypothetical protein